ncbi:hypothetical protein C8R43DRAFT_1138974 [Mycena crocata]|nr:hypothetical protein C8R43DRAFT_1138974 [Mycena crocata]
MAWQRRRADRRVTPRHIRVSARRPRHFYPAQWFRLKNIAPRFEFGLRLSYTMFGYSGLKISPVSGGARHHGRRAAEVKPHPAHANVSSTSVRPSSTLSASATTMLSASVSASEAQTAPAPSPPLRP